MSSRGFLLFDLAKESALGGAPFLSNDLNINRLASAIAAGFDSKGDLFPDAKIAPVIRQRGVVNVYIGTKRTFGKTETFLDIPMHDDSSGSIHDSHLHLRLTDVKCANRSWSWR